MTQTSTHLGHIKKTRKRKKRYKETKRPNRQASEKRKEKKNRTNGQVIRVGLKACFICDLFTYYLIAGRKNKQRSSGSKGHWDLHGTSSVPFRVQNKLSFSLLLALSMLLRNCSQSHSLLLFKPFILCAESNGIYQTQPHIPLTEPTFISLIQNIHGHSRVSNGHKGHCSLFNLKKPIKNIYI